MFTTDKDRGPLRSRLAPSFPLYRVPLIVEFDPPDALFESVKAVSARSSSDYGGTVRAIEYWSVVTVRAIATRLPDADRARVGIGARPDVLRARLARIAASR